MAKLISKYEQLMERLRREGRVSDMPEDERQELMEAIEEDLQAYRFENQKRMIDSQEEISTVVLTS